MALSTVEGISIRGMCTVVPKTVVENRSLSPYFEHNELDKIMKSTGINRRRVMSDEQTPLSLSVIACNSIIDNLEVDLEDIKLVVFVTQTPDMPFPGNAVQLQHQLGLSKDTIAFDINLGCSGFVYGLWQVSALLNSSNSKNALLVVGDATSKQYSCDNKAVNTLFGDAVNATLIERSEGASPMYFDLGTDGSGAPYLMQGNGGLSKPNVSAELSMDGMQVFAFTLREVPASVRSVLSYSNATIEDLDKVIMHQANSMMLKHLADKLNIPDTKLVIDIDGHGNTSSASIPLALTNNYSLDTASNLPTVLLAGFGIGWSWGTAVLNIASLMYCETVEL